MIHRRIATLAITGACLAVFAASAQAAAGNGHIRGIVVTRGHQPTPPPAANLTYHGGRVQHTNTTHAIYWVPSGYSVQSGYKSVINTFFKNVAAASGATSNVYFSDTQYSDTTLGNILYSSKFAGALTDTDAFPSSGCVDVYTSVCLTDAQLQTEIAKFVKAKGLPTGLNHEYFLFTPKKVGSCTDATSTECSFTYYCAYHSNFVNSAGQEILYANMPYAAIDSSNCGSGESPNHNDADSTLNVTSHEHNETITDPYGTAWYDSSGNENGDKCAWNFGTPLGGSAGAEYNQVINGGHYYLQQEWSNHSSGCVLTGT
jgi:hypothetical protein